jgi:hypothetical protein
LLPFFPPISRVATYGFLSQWSFGHCSIYTLPVPGNSCHLIVFSETGAPDGNKEAGMHPTHEMGVDCTRTAVSLLWQCLPLAAGAKNVHNGFKDLSVLHRFSATTRFASVRFIRVTLWSGNQGRDFLPKSIRDFPRLNLWHNILPASVINAGRK